LTSGPPLYYLRSSCRMRCARPWVRGRFRTASAAETVEPGRRIAVELPRKCVVLLIGNLGAGKTTLAKGIAEGLGAATEDEVSSPTFTLIHEYGGGRLYHVDLYRLDEAREVETLGLDELFDREAVVLIEWGERFPQLLPPDRMEIRLRAAADDGLTTPDDVARCIVALCHRRRIG